MRQKQKSGVKSNNTNLFIGLHLNLIAHFPETLLLLWLWHNEAVLMSLSS